MICQLIFAILALVIFLLKILLKSASKSSFFCFGVDIRFWSCNFRHRCGQFYCVLQLSLCSSHCRGCVKVARCRLKIVIVLEWLHPGCDSDLSVIFAIWALVMFLLKMILKSASKLFFFCFGVDIRFWSCNFRHRCG